MSDSVSGEPKRSVRTRNFAIATGVAVLVVAVALLVVRPWDGGGSTAISNATTEGSSVAPLTGLETPGVRSDLLGQPALVVKIDAAARADGQFGLGEADVVVEAQVEGISRFLAVFHSQRAEEVGPVRSARTTDVDLLPVFGRPLFSYSGGNQGVLEALGNANGFQDVSEAVVPDAYRREESRPVPHDLLADAAELRDAAAEPFGPPVPLFLYRSATDPVSGSPSSGMSVSVGSEVTFVWDGRVAGWRRWAHGEPQVDAAGEQLAPGNVVVLEVDHVPSAADNRSPEAVTVGQGQAWAYSQGTVQQGSWARPDRNSVWDLRTPEGVMTLEPGTTWIVLAEAPPEQLSTARVEDLLPEADGA